MSLFPKMGNAVSPDCATCGPKPVSWIVGIEETMPLKIQRDTCDMH